MKAQLRQRDWYDAYEKTQKNNCHPYNNCIDVFNQSAQTSKVGEQLNNQYEISWTRAKAKNYDIENITIGKINVYFELNYDANSGEGAPEKEKAFTESTVLSQTVPTNGEMKFLGWAMEKNAEEPQFQPGEEITLSNNTTLYAVWEDIVPPTGDGYDLRFCVALMAISALGCSYFKSRKKED
jgi:hypothetical protein